MTSCTVFTVEAAGSDRPVQCLTITAVQRERDTQSLRYHSRTRTRQSTIADCFLSRPLCLYVPVSMAVQQVSLKQQRILAHDPVNTFGIDAQAYHQVLFVCEAAPIPTITIRGQLSELTQQ